MKTALVLLIALTATASIVDIAAETKQPTSCLHNPFLPELKDHHVSLFKSPAQYEGSSCGDEWKNFGVCCDQRGLLKYAKQDRQNITLAAASVINSFIRIKNSFAMVRRRAYSVSREDLEKMKPHHKAFYLFIRGKSSFNFKSKMDKLLSKRAFTQKLTRCFKKINTSRSNALCSVCSGRSTSFFLGRKIRMADTDCNRILEQCAPAFQGMVLILEVLANFLASFKDSLKGQQGDYSKNLNYLNELLDTISREQVHVEIKQFLGLPGAEKSKTANSLCSKFLKIKGETFIEKSQAILQKFGLNSIMKTTAIIRAMLLRANSRLKAAAKLQPKSAPSKQSFQVEARSPRTRLLSDLDINTIKSLSLTQDLPPIDSLFIGDVSIVVTYTEKSVVSFTAGITRHTMTSIPFDISLQFP